MSPRRSPSRVLVLGAGSIGRRHAQNLVAAGATVTVTDPVPGRASAIESVATAAFEAIDLAAYDGVVLASPTVFHADQLRSVLDVGRRVLVEKPLAVTAAGLDEVVGAGTDVMVGYNLRFHEPLRRAIQMCHDGEVGQIRTARVWFGSWLPGWRPDVDYRTTYSARRSLGGGVLLDAIHELDLALWLLGPELRVVAAVVDRIGPLEIDVEDTVSALLRHASGAVVHVSLDYLSRRYRRGIEVIGDCATLRYDWSREVIEVEDADGLCVDRAAVPISRSYELQAAHFLAWLRGEADPPVDGRLGIASVALADAIRDASS